MALSRGLADTSVFVAREAGRDSLDIRDIEELLDTSVFVAREAGRPIPEASVPDELAVSVITIGELRAGVLAADDATIRDRRLSTLTAALALQPVPINEAVAATWAKLRLILRDRGLRMPVNDSWIAATAMSLGVALRVIPGPRFPVDRGTQCDSGVIRH